MHKSPCKKISARFLRLCSYHLISALTSRLRKRHRTWLPPLSVCEHRKVQHHLWKLHTPQTMLRFCSIRLLDRLYTVLLLASRRSFEGECTRGNGEPAEGIQTGQANPEWAQAQQTFIRTCSWIISVRTSGVSLLSPEHHPVPGETLKVAASMRWEERRRHNCFTGFQNPTGSCKNLGNRSVESAGSRLRAVSSQPREYPFSRIKLVCIHWPPCSSCCRITDSQ